jgi:hypothetical protein
LQNVTPPGAFNREYIRYSVVFRNATAV